MNEILDRFFFQASMYFYTDSRHQFVASFQVFGGHMWSAATCTGQV
jgi:hypothetical protein